MFTPTSSEGAVVIRELGFFASDRDLLRAARQPFQSISGVRFYSTIAAALTLAWPAGDGGVSLCLW